MRTVWNKYRVKYTGAALRKNVLLAMLLFLVTPAVTFAQDPKKDLQQMSMLYRSATSYSMDIGLNLFSDQADFNQQHKGKACKDGANYFSQLMGRTTLFNGRCNLLIDENRKLIIYNKPEKTSKAKYAQEEELLTDSSFYATAKLRYVFQNDKQKKIEVKAQTSAYDKMEIVLNAKTYALEQVIYYYSKSTNNGAAGYTKSEITYSNVQINRPVPSDQFSEKKYITRNKNTWQGIGNYAGYQFVDQTHPITPKR